MIVHDALKKLEDQGIELDQNARADLVKKLMVITCSDQGNAAPVLNV